MWFNKLDDAGYVYDAAAGRAAPQYAVPLERVPAAAGHKLDDAGYVYDATTPGASTYAVPIDPNDPALAPDETV